LSDRAGKEDKESDSRGNETADTTQGKQKITPKWVDVNLMLTLDAIKGKHKKSKSKHESKQDTNNIQIIKCGQSDDDIWICAFLFHVANKARKASQDIKEA
jgi:hypothetical protein